MDLGSVLIVVYFLLAFLPFPLPLIYIVFPYLKDLFSVWKFQYSILGVQYMITNLPK